MSSIFRTVLLGTYIASASAMAVGVGDSFPSGALSKL